MSDCWLFTVIPLLLLIINCYSSNKLDSISIYNKSNGLNLKSSWSMSGDCVPEFIECNYFQRWFAGKYKSAETSTSAIIPDSVASAVIHTIISPITISDTSISQTNSSVSPRYIESTAPISVPGLTSSSHPSTFKAKQELLVSLAISTEASTINGAINHTFNDGSDGAISREATSDGLYSGGGHGDTLSFYLNAIYIQQSIAAIPDPVALSTYYNSIWTVNNTNISPTSDTSISRSIQGLTSSLHPSSPHPSSPHPPSPHPSSPHPSSLHPSSKPIFNILTSQREAVCDGSNGLYLLNLTVLTDSTTINRRDAIYNRNSNPKWNPSVLKKRYEAITNILPPQHQPRNITTTIDEILCVNTNMSKKRESSFIASTFGYISNVYISPTQSQPTSQQKLFYSTAITINGLNTRSTTLHPIYASISTLFDDYIINQPVPYPYIVTTSRQREDNGFTRTATKSSIHREKKWNQRFLFGIAHGVNTHIDCNIIFVWDINDIKRVNINNSCFDQHGIDRYINSMQPPSDNKQKQYELQPITPRLTSNDKKQAKEEDILLLICVSSWMSILMVVWMNKNNTTSFIFVFISIINILYAANIYQPWTTIQSQDQGLPRDRDMTSMAIGYDDSTDRIWLLGGNDVKAFNFSKQLVSISFQDAGDSIIANITNHGASYLSDEFYAFGQTYAQIGDSLFLIHAWDGSLFKFNVQTADIDYNYRVLPRGINDESCLASLGVDYLFISYEQQSIIFNITSNTFIFTVPEMQHKIRRSLACIVHNQHFYAIGGYLGEDDDDTLEFLDSIEVLYVGDLKTIQNENFTFIESLPTPLIYHRAISYGDDIVIIGGYNGSGYNHQIYVINTVTNNVTSAGLLDYGTYMMSPIVIYPYIYIFGGEEKKWQYHVLPLRVLLFNI